MYWKVTSFNPTSHEVEITRKDGSKVTTTIPKEHRSSIQSKTDFVNKFAATHAPEVVARRQRVLVYGILCIIIAIQAFFLFHG